MAHVNVVVIRPAQLELQTGAWVNDYREELGTHLHDHVEVVVQPIDLFVEVRNCQGDVVEHRGCGHRGLLSDANHASVLGDRCWNSSTRLPDGSRSRTCLRPGPSTMSLRNRASGSIVVVWFRMVPSRFVAS